MLNSSVLEVVVGLFVVFFVFATICSGVVEWISRALHLRAAYLLLGLRHMLDGAGDQQKQQMQKASTPADGVGGSVGTPDSPPAASGEPDTGPHPDGGTNNSLADRLLSLPLLATFGQQHDGDPVDKRVMPSYLPAETFATAVVDLVVPDESGATSMDTVIERVNGLPEPARSTLLAFAKSAQGSTAAFRTAVARWYDDNMTRVSGWYKRHVTLFLVAIALVVTVACNINTITLARTLYTNQDARQALVNQANALTSCPSGQAARCATQATDAVDRLGQTSLPLFWQTTNPTCTTPRSQCSTLKRVGLDSASGWVIAIVGWLIAIIAIAMGAPFWFNLLSKIASLRATGDPPPKASTQPSVPEPSAPSQIAVLETPTG
jgi:hypothetical protein